MGAERRTVTSESDGNGPSEVSRRAVLRSGAVVTAVAGLGLSGVVGTAAAKKNGRIPIDGPTRITEPGYYVLTRDIVGEGGVVVEPEVDDVTIDGQGYTIDGQGQYQWGIIVGIGGYPGPANTVNPVVKDVTLTGFTIAGLEFENTNGGAIRNVTFTENPNWGLSFLDGRGATIEKCTFSNNDTGVFGTEGSGGHVFTNNEIEGNRWGIWLDESPGVVFKNNRFEKNERYELNASSFSDDAQIINNLFYRNGTGLNIGDYHSSPNLVRGNRFVENDGHGITIDESFVFPSGFSLIEKNKLFRNGGDGINMFAADDWVITKNVIRNNGGDGIELQNSDDNVVRKNVIKRNGGQPIEIDADSTGNVVEDNRT
ncbi:nitrous oxide reductase family maturation protein NosD [Haloferax sp. YSSS75]|uniref:right-handed parallel beta-helix repeat-containing protein n=1 Tax=Haloferax sp. YSSS75 TaxID=3388564 RepID=UPI00398D4CC4